VVAVLNNIIEAAVDPSLVREGKINLTKLVEELKAYGKGGGKPDHIVVKLNKPIDPSMIASIVEKLVCPEQPVP